MAIEREDTLSSRWREAVESTPESLFLHFEDAEERSHKWTYAEWDTRTLRVASYLVASGVGVGDRVHVALPNSPAFVAIWLACIRLGAVFVPSDPRATDRELAVHTSMTRPVLGICAADGASSYPGDAGMRVLSIDPDDTDLSEWAADDLSKAPIDSRPNMPAAILFTSGTTSQPKGVVITQGNYAFAGDTMAEAAALRAGDRFLVVLPLFHGNAQYYSVAAAISAGAAVCLMPGFSASRFFIQAARSKATHASLFAAPMRMILARGATPVEGLCLRHCWYAQNLPPAQVDEFADLAGCRPRQLYGMTETVAAVMTQRKGDDEPGVMGETTPGCDVELRELDGENLVAVGEIGEITVSGERGHALFAEYFESPHITDAAFRAGRFRTGDLATQDQAGRFRFVGRLSDVLKVAGENVSTVEIEDVLESHPGVLDAAVTGAPDPIRDEVPIAFVVRTSDATDLDEPTLLRFAASRLAPSKCPRSITFVSELPRTSVGKIRKFRLVEPQ